MALAGRTGRGIAVVASGERRAEDADSPLGTALPDAGPFAAWRPLRLFSDVFSLITTLRHSDRAPIVPRGASFLGNKTTPKRAMRRTSQIRHGERTEHAHFPLIEDGRDARCAGERPDVRSALSSCAAPFTKGRRLRKENAASILRPADRSGVLAVSRDWRKKGRTPIRRVFDQFSCGGAYEKNGELHQYRHPRGYPTRYLHCKGIEKLVCCRWNVPEIAISGVCKIPDGRLAVSPSNARKRGTPCQGAPLER